MASKDSATRTKTNAKPIKGVDGAHHGARDVFQAMTEEQHAALMRAIGDPGGDPDSMFDAFRAQIEEKRALGALQDKGLDAYMAEWRTLTPAQQKKAAARLGPLREKVKALPPFENISLEVERQAPNHLAATLCRRESDFRGEEVPVELHTLERLLSPSAQAWEQAAHYVNQALADERLRRHPVVKAIFDKLASAIMDHTWDDLATPDNVLRFLVDPLAEKRARTTGARHAATSKNVAAREWVQELWSLWNGSDSGKKAISSEIAKRLEARRLEKRRPEKPLTKEEFSECVADLLKDGIGSQVDPTDVRARTISVEWLKGL